MNKREFGRIAVHCGWTRHRDVDTYFRKVLDQCMVQIIPSVAPITGGIVIDLSESCITEEMKRSMDFVVGKDHWSGILSNRQPSTSEIRSHFDEADVQSLLEGAQSWASKVNRIEALERYAAYSTTAVPGYVVGHLVALALLGRRDQLLDYRRSFSDGNPYGFVPYVTPEMLDRALELEP